MNKFLTVIVAIGMLSACTAFYPPKAAMPSREGIMPGETVTVEGNKNVYSVAHQYNVSMRDLIVLNNLQPPFVLKNGQKLVLPAGANGTAVASPLVPPSEMAPPPGPAGTVAVEQSTLPPIENAPVIMGTPVSPAQTRYANTPKPAATSPNGTPTAETLTTPSPNRAVSTTAGVTNEDVASIAPSQAQPSADAPAGSFVWPVQGPVISGFGPKGQGLNNDGVNIGAPKGAPVVAAAAGIVVYAGNEMKGFGNLVLIRHQGGWVTAYAHLDRVLVAKDAVVAQGDMIGTVGKTGSVDKPQLHFETRYEGKPVDPAGAITKEKG